MVRIALITLAILFGLDQVMLGGKFTAAGERTAVTILRHAR